MQEGRYDAACHLVHDDPGLQFWRDPVLEQEQLSAAVYAHLKVQLRDVDDKATRLGEPLGDGGGGVALGWLELSVSAPLVVHETQSSPFLEGPAAQAILVAALPPLLDPPAPLVPPGPLEMPAAPDPTPEPPPQSAGGGGGFFGAIFDLVTLPVRIVGDVVGGLLSIPLGLSRELFGINWGGGGSGGSSSPLRPADGRLPGEAILPPAAFERVKEQRNQEHAAALAVVAAARAERLHRLAPLVASLSERCLATQTKPCRRLVLVGDPGAPVEVQVGMGTPDAPCGLDRPLLLSGLSLAARNQGAHPPELAKPTAPADVAAVDDAAALFGARSPTKVSRDAVDDVVCRVDVRQRWKRLLPKATRDEKLPRLSVRLATGSLVGQGVTVEVPAAARFFVGSRALLRRGDQLKLVVGAVDKDDVGFLGGVVTEFQGVLPLRVEGDSLAVECR